MSNLDLLSYTDFKPLVLVLPQNWNAPHLAPLVLELALINAEQSGLMSTCN